MNPSSGQTQPSAGPPDTEKLFGRQYDLQTVQAMLQLPECRLVTLTGPGGIGKTTLAQKIAHHLADDFAGQVTLVPLQPVSAAEFVPLAVLEHLGYRPYSGDDPAAQLIQFLREKYILLVLDNFEHLLEASSLVTQILEQTRHVKLLITSREVLNLHQEWVWPLRGIPYPPTDYAENAINYAAIRMFDARARRVNPTFSLEDELSTVVQICALVEGSPLAIELASVWLKSLPCRDILEELRRSLDILSTSMRDIPEAHRSIRAVFDRSWQLLSSEEQRALQHLSLFWGSFTREAARAVAGVSLPMLSALIDKSLLYLNAQGRYQFHELFRQDAYHHLKQDATAFRQADTAFVMYYRDFLAERFDHVWSTHQYSAIKEITAELHNIRRVSDHMAAADDIVISRRAISTLAEIYQLVGYYREGRDFTTRIIHQLEPVDRLQLSKEHLYLLAEMLNALGWLNIRLGEFHDAEVAILRSKAIYDTHGLLPAAGFATDPQATMGELQSILGNPEAARSWSQAAYQDAAGRNDALNQTMALYVLTAVALKTGDYDLAEHYATEAVQISRQVGNDWFLAYCLNQQGHIRRDKGDFAGAQQHYEESHRIRERFGDPEGQAVALLHLSGLALLQDRYQQAADMLHDSLSFYQHIEDRGGLFTAHQGLALALTGLGQVEQAHQHLLAAAQIVAAVQVDSWWLALCEAAGRLYTAAGDPERGIYLIQLAAAHHESSSITRQRAVRWLQQNGYTAPRQEAHPELNTLAAQLAQEIRTFTCAPAATPAPSMMVDALSRRELEILRLIAQGLTNQEIADQLVLTLGTVKTHNYNIFSKLAVKNRSQAIRRAQEMNLL